MLRIKKQKIGSTDDFIMNKAEWEKLQSGNDMTAYQYFEWNILLVEEFFTYTYNKVFSKLYLYKVYDDNNIILLAPIIIQKTSIHISWAGREKGIYILGVGSYSDYLNFIYSDFSSDAVEFLIRSLKQDFRGLSINFDLIREDTQIGKYLRSLHTIDTIHTSVYVSIPISEDAFLAALSKSTKQNLRTALNRINRDEMDYTLEYSRELDKSTIDRCLLLHAIRLHTKSKFAENKGLHKLSFSLLMKNKSNKEKRYNIVKESMQRCKNAFAVIVRFNGVVVGYLYGLTDHEAFRVMHNAFSEDFKFYSPMFRGIYDFILKMINVAADEVHIAQIDFTRGKEEYKYKLGGKEIECLHFKL